MDVYLLRMEGTDYFKVGISDNIEQRIKAIQTSNPFNIILIERAEQVDAQLVERDIHQALEGCRFRGEWFHGDSEQIHRTFLIINAMARVDNLLDIPDDPPPPLVSSGELGKKDVVAMLIEQGWTKTKIIREVWKARGGRNYTNASNEYDEIVGTLLSAAHADT